MPGNDENNEPNWSAISTLVGLVSFMISSSGMVVTVAITVFGLLIAACCGGIGLEAYHRDTQNEVVRLDGERQRLNDQVESLEKTVDSTTKEMVDLKRQMVAERNKAAADREALQSRVAGAESEVKSLREALESANQEATRLHATGEEQGRRIKALEQKLNEAEVTVEELRADLTTTRERLSQQIRISGAEKWEGTIKSAISGECRRKAFTESWGACEARIRSKLQPFGDQAVACYESGRGSPVYIDSNGGGIPTNGIALGGPAGRHGVVVFCDWNLADAGDETVE